ncbi:hypothetical protein DTO280E4_5653 [Paecilomyces variotii]|nr:hypothetical protein DTO280E4_5653 [Paecilomyces variotii]
MAEASVLASCYTVNSSAVVRGFHYCTTSGAGAQCCPVVSGTESSWSNNKWPEQRGEAAHTISEECERLFCDKLSAIFLGERSRARRASLEMDAYDRVSRSNQSRASHNQIQRWLEVWNYASDDIYRGFVTRNNPRTLFVFFEGNALGYGLKSGLMALFELASMPGFDCSQIVACVSRSVVTAEFDTVRDLGWCGFNLTTLEQTLALDSAEPSVSSRWIFLVAEV